MEKYIKKDGYTLRIGIDEYFEGWNPRECSDNLGRLYIWVKHYEIGDKNEYNDPQDFKDSDEYRNAEVVLPIYVYIHSGIALSCLPCGDPWDSWQAGYIICTKEAAGKCGYSKQDIIKILREEVEEYNEYMQGKTYLYYSIEGLNGETIDSCTGFEYSDSVIADMLEYVPAEYEYLFEGVKV